MPYRCMNLSNLPTTSEGVLSDWLKLFGAEVSSIKYNPIFNHAIVIFKSEPNRAISITPFMGRAITVTSCEHEREHEQPDPIHQRVGPPTVGPPTPRVYFSLAKYEDMKLAGGIERVCTLNVTFENVDVDKYRFFMTDLNESHVKEFLKHNSYNKNRQIQVNTGPYRFYLLCGPNLGTRRVDDIREFHKLLEQCRNPENGCKVVEENVDVDYDSIVKIVPDDNPAKVTPQMGGSKSRNRKSRNRKSRNRKHCNRKSRKHCNRKSRKHRNRKSRRR